MEGGFRAAGACKARFRRPAVGEADNLRGDLHAGMPEGSCLRVRPIWTENGDYRTEMARQSPFYCALTDDKECPVPAQGQTRMTAGPL